MVEIEKIINELIKYPQGILQTELAKNLGCLDNINKTYGMKLYGLSTLLKRKEIRREKDKNGGFIIFLNK